MFPTRQLVLGLALGVALAGCATDPDPNATSRDYDEGAEYRRVYAATYKVLATHFNVETSRRAPNRSEIIATSTISTDGVTQYRMKVTARVMWDEDEILRPEVRVLEQVDMGIADASARNVGQMNHLWRTTGFNADMERQLLNEIHAELGHGRFKGDLFMRNTLRDTSAPPSPSDPSAY